MIDAKQVFEILARDHSRMLWAYLCSVVPDRNVAEDLFQETLLTAWRSLDRYDRSLPFGPWLRGIAGRLFMAKRRHLARDRRYLVEVADLDALEDLHARLAARPNGHHGDLWEDKLDLLRRCLDELPEPHRQVLNLYYWEDLGCQEIATRLSRPLEAVKKQLQRVCVPLSPNA